jgi:hypothetical protein
VKNAFYGCSELKRLYLGAFHETTLASLLPNLHLPLLKELRLRPVKTNGNVPWPTAAQRDIILDFVERHVETLTFVELVHKELNPDYIKALGQRLETWFVCGLGQYKRKLR